MTTAKKRVPPMLSLLLGMAMLGAPVPAAVASGAPEAPAPSASFAPALADVDEYFRQQTEAGAFSGAVLVAFNEETLFERGYGLANRETGEPITPDTGFNLGSVDKFVTRVAIFQLLEEGRLSLDDTVGEILPNYPNPAVRDDVTVAHLVDMKAGVPSFFNEKFMTHRAELRTTDDYLALFADQPLRFEPGEKTEYSNGGFVILGKIIEQLSGMSYSDYVERKIAAPAGMTSTSIDAANGRPGFAIGYTRASNDPRQKMDPAAPLRPNQDLLPGRGSSSGGGYSTVRDFARLAAALRKGKLLKPETMDLAFGEGFRQGTGKSTGWVGGFPGVSTSFKMYPDGLTLIVFTNLDHPTAPTVGEEAFKRIQAHMQGTRAD